MSRSDGLWLAYLVAPPGKSSESTAVGLGQQSPHYDWVTCAMRSDALAVGVHTLVGRILRSPCGTQGALK